MLPPWLIDAALSLHTVTLPLHTFAPLPLSFVHADQREARATEVRMCACAWRGYQVYELTAPGPDRAVPKFAQALGASGPLGASIPQALGASGPGHVEALVQSPEPELAFHRLGNDRAAPQYRRGSACTS